MTTRNPERATVSVPMPARVLIQIQKRASRKGMSVGQYISKYLSEYSKSEDHIESAEAERLV